MKALFTSVAALALTVGFAGSANADYSLNILHINDLHSRIESINKYDSTCNAKGEEEGKCFGGVARVKSMLDQRRAALKDAGKNVLTIDAGDQFQGSLFYSTYKGAAAVEFMNGIGFDVMAVGNHEFDDGPQGLADFLAKAEFPVISGNIDVSSEPLLAGKISGYIIKEVGGQKIGLVSTLAEDTVETSSPGDKVIFSSSEDYLKQAVQELTEQGVNKIIAVTHEGLTKDMDLASKVSGIDMIVGGHSHTLLSNTDDKAAGPYPVMVKNPDGKDVPIVQAYAYSKYVGDIEVTFNDNGDIISAKGDPILLDKSVAMDEGFKARVAELGAPIEELKVKVIGSIEADIDGSRDNCRLKECEMGSVVADAILDRVKAQGVSIVIQNGGGLRSSIQAGEVTMGEVLSVLPFQNTLATFQLTGAGVVEALENGLSQVEKVAGRFPQVAGIKYSWSAAKPVGERVISVEVMKDGAWAPIDPEAVYGVASNNYMRSGGDGYKVFKTDGKNAYDYGPGLEEVLASYIAKNPGFKPVLDGRITEVK
ncbi:bifunctional metallophosphatase/5'-nucleotidase [Cohaesibacter celericrescens]|uniref:Multifunctional 2',3'-cyclic-nucleotide 2'-phosphodiesterase/5'-nucleotidase/3'-nucleotidase n=1 Tax=Cohaesibacter celericrescens TaxID=2067669 RepID=A0A2N5XV56_9HYPH|nr:bifunctional metallophosphatase/5'-nucleotidase [Cohaesibacter celericrescens]PLW78402.1 multifunctional 2',3'-cyclic-nucleotide 2'-phosphodiesterase/5'-nucleotidase/3'-nucleotidase [Cohaesibacter celericrescens]